MKKFALVIIAFVLTALNSGCHQPEPLSYNIVFVHIGDSIPSYLKIALEQAALFNPTSSLYLVANQRALDVFKEKPALPNLITVSCESLKRTKEHDAFARESKLNREFRGGFVFFASERFLYLHDLIQQFKLKRVFHLESDNMLYVNLEELLPVFSKKYHGIAATFDTHQRCIPGFVYISERYAMKRLAKFMAAHAKRSEDDMKTLSRYRRKNNKRWIDALPIITDEYVKTNALKTKRKIHLFSNNVKQFDSVFDAAAIGQYLGGIDARNDTLKDTQNRASTAGFINEKCVFNPALLQVEWKKDLQGRKVPYIKHGDKMYRINNLHVHSKKLHEFTS